MNVHFFLEIKLFALFFFFGFCLRSLKILECKRGTSTNFDAKGYKCKHYFFKLGKKTKTVIEYQKTSRMK